MAREDLLQRVRDFAHGGHRARGVDGELEQVRPAGGALRRAARRRPPWGRAPPEPLELGDLLLAHLAVVDFQDLDRGVVGGAELVDADDRLAAAVDARLRARRGLLDAHLRDAGGDRAGHAAERLDLVDARHGPARELVGEPLDEAAAPGVGDAAGAALLLDEELRVARDAGGEVGRQR